MRSPRLGTNLDSFQDYSLEWPLIDAFKRSRPWISGVDGGSWEDSRPLAVDDSGWVKRLSPGQVARTLLFWTEPSRHPVGDYVVTYEGEGALDFWNTATVKSSSPGRYVVSVGEAPNGVAIFLTRTNPENPLRNLRVLLPGAACGAAHETACRTDADCGGSRCIPLETANWRFHPDFLAGLAPYGVLRFMNWMGTNGSTERSWSDRPKASDARWTLHGVPLEVLIELSNETGAAPWFTLPIQADDDYLRRFAEVVRDGSKSPRVYIELSNEVWNSAFPQGGYAEAQGQKQGLSGNAFEARLRWYSRRSVEMFRIFEQAFGGPGRLVRVLASQAANPWVSETILSFEGAAGHADALAIAPYFGADLGTRESPVNVTSLSLPAFMKELEGPAVDRAADWMEQQQRVSRRFKVRLVAYEGGQHLVGVAGLENDAGLNRLFDAANRDPRMKDVYRRYLAAWETHGGDLFVHFSSFGGVSKWGRWGAVERVGQPRSEAPKLDALLEFAAAGK